MTKAFHITKILIIILVVLTVTLSCDTSTTNHGINIETQVARTVEAINGGGGTPIDMACTTIDFNGITLCYDHSLAQGVTTEIIPAASSTDEPWYATPQTEQINFTNYITGKKFHDPRIMVFPVNAYLALGNNPSEEITNLQQYLANKPNIPAGTIPFLPAFNAQQLFQLIPAFITFQNGQGIRFLAEYGQYAAPVNNTDLFYTFQGITNDGLYYVSVILPITHPSLPPDYNVDAALQDQINANYDAYLAGILPTLSAQPLNRFTPDISLLDAMIQSMQIH